MKHRAAVLFLVLLSACRSHSVLSVRQILPPELGQVAGLTLLSNHIWTIGQTDKPQLCELDSAGHVISKVAISKDDAFSPGGIASDDGHFYLLDAAAKRVLILGTDGKKQGSLSFDLPNADKKLTITCYKDSLYLFSSDSLTGPTSLFSLPKKEGDYKGRFVDSFNAEGMITGAAINPSGTELALTGYKPGHHYPFILLFKGFSSGDFFDARNGRVELTDKNWDWRVEAIAFKDDNFLYFACAKTPEVEPTIYGVKRKLLKKLDRDANADDGDDSKHQPHLSIKGHLK